MDERFEDLSRNAYKKVWTRLSTTPELAKLYVIGEVSEEEILAQARHTQKRLEERIGILPTDDVLEIGCGIGRVGQALASKCKSWTGLDVSESMLSYAKERLSEFDNVHLVEGNGYDLSVLPDNSFHKVYCTVVFMHLDDWERYRYLEESLRVLKPGGVCYVDNINLMHPEGWKFFMEHANIPIKDRPPHMSRCSTPQEIETYFNQAGFANIEQTLSNLWIETTGQKALTG